MTSLELVVIAEAFTEPIRGLSRIRPECPLDLSSYIKHHVVAYMVKRRYYQIFFSLVPHRDRWLSKTAMAVDPSSKKVDGSGTVCMLKVWE